MHHCPMHFNQKNSSHSLKQLERFCNYEKAEYLLERSEIDSFHSFEEDHQWEPEVMAILENMTP